MKFGPEIPEEWRTTDTTDTSGTSFTDNLDLERLEGTSNISIKMTINQYSKKITITNDTNNNTDVSLMFNVDEEGQQDYDTNIQHKLGWSLGFRYAQYEIPRGESITSEGVPFMSDPQNVYLSIEDYKTNSTQSYLVSHADSMRADNILTHIRLYDGPGYNKDEGFTGRFSERSRTYSGPVDIHRLTIKLIDGYGRIVDLNNMDWTFSLAFVKLLNN